MYPPQFWVDAAIAVAALSMLIVLLLMGYTWPTRYRKQVALTDTVAFAAQAAASKVEDTAAKAASEVKEAASKTNPARKNRSCACRR